MVRAPREARLRAAHEAERMAVATSLDPPVERAELQPAVEAWNEAKGNDNPKVRSRHASGNKRTSGRSVVGRSSTSEV